jgi:DNA mismatch endonuclease (patch repair protein)
LGLRFRKNVKDLPGKPDIVFPRERVAVFCDGDFWHGRNWKEKKEKIKQGSNAPYWLSKIEANMERDKRHNVNLQSLCWTVLRFWESDILADSNAAATKIREVVLSKRTK